MFLFNKNILALLIGIKLEVKCLKREMFTFIEKERFNVIFRIKKIPQGMRNDGNMALLAGFEPTIFRVGV